MRAALAALLLTSLAPLGVASDFTAHNAIIVGSGGEGDPGMCPISEGLYLPEGTAVPVPHPGPACFHTYGDWTGGAEVLRAGTSAALSAHYALSDGTTTLARGDFCGRTTFDIPVGAWFLFVSVRHAADPTCESIVLPGETTGFPRPVVASVRGCIGYC